MSTTNDGGPAFPIVAMDAATGQPINGCFYMGMSLRDYFAAQAISGVFACIVSTDARTALLKASASAGKSIEDLVAKSAYQLADAMLAAREGGSK